MIKKKEKKNRYNQNCIHNQKRQKSSSSATEVNAAQPEKLNFRKKKTKNQTCPNKTIYNYNEIKCYNCQNLSYYASIYQKFSKN